MAEGTPESVYSLPLLLAKGSVIDFETNGVPGRDAVSEVVTLGYAEGGTVTVVQRRSKEKKPFYDVIKAILGRLPRPLYAYNFDFEKAVIRLELGIQAQESEFVDLFTPWKAKAERLGMKWPKLDELVSEPEDYFHARKTSGRQVPGLWDRYLAGPGNEWIPDSIRDHCLSDVLRETTLLLRYSLYFKGKEG